MKTCRDCHTRKPLDEFYTTWDRKRQQRFYRPECKACTLAAQRARSHAQNPPQPQTCPVCLATFRRAPGERWRRYCAPTCATEAERERVRRARA